MTTDHQLDVVIVGAGFSGLSCLHELRKRGFNCQVFEAGSGPGGVWHWNNYPGSRVDSEYFVYQFHQSEIGREFKWSERFSGWKEIQAYFAHVDKEQNFSRDILFNTRVTAGSFDRVTNTWSVTTSNGRSTKCRHFILCIGNSSKPYIPEIIGLATFAGEVYHTGDWSSYGKIDLHGKRVAVIGTGASGVQVIESVAPIVDHLTVFQRTPTMAFPLQQKRRVNSSWRFPNASDYDQLLDENLNTFSGVGIDFYQRKCAEATCEERQEFFEKMYARGGLSLWLGNYEDILLDGKASQHMYDFWRKKTAPRIDDPVKRDLLVPTKPPYPFGTKRPSLEQCYYEVFNQPNVKLVDLLSNPIKTITPSGFFMENGDQVEVDIIVMATGFDVSTGGLYEIDLRNGVGLSLRESWKDGIRTQLGFLAQDFPNLYFVYGPQSAAAFSNAATIAKIQTDWLVSLLVWMRTNEKSRVTPKMTEVTKWTSTVQQVWNNSLFPLAQSWFQGSNIPGKKREPLYYAGGLPRYVEAMNEAAASDYNEFKFE